MGHENLTGIKMESLIFTLWNRKKMWTTKFMTITGDKTKIVIQAKITSFFLYKRTIVYECLSTPVLGIKLLHSVQKTIRLFLKEIEKKFNFVFNRGSQSKYGFSFQTTKIRLKFNDTTI